MYQVAGAQVVVDQVAGAQTSAALDQVAGAKVLDQVAGVQVLSWWREFRYCRELNDRNSCDESLCALHVHTSLVFTPADSLRQLK